MIDVLLQGMISAFEQYTPLSLPCLSLLLALQRNRATLSREEQELIDVERQMEEQLVQQHMELERVVAIRTEPNTEGGVGFLCKWRGLPYSEATWENKEMIQKMENGEKMAQAYQVRSSSLAKQEQGFCLIYKKKW